MTELNRTRTEFHCFSVSDRQIAMPRTHDHFHKWRREFKTQLPAITDQVDQARIPTQALDRGRRKTPRLNGFRAGNTQPERKRAKPDPIRFSEAPHRKNPQYRSAHKMGTARTRNQINNNSGNTSSGSRFTRHQAYSERENQPVLCEDV